MSTFKIAILLALAAKPAPEGVTTFGMFRAELCSADGTSLAAQDLESVAEPIEFAGAEEGVYIAKFCRLDGSGAVIPGSEFQLDITVTAPEVPPAPLMYDAPVSATVTITPE